jgi:hypothetical protein
MHYKNGRESKVGDLVVGVTHNSDHKLRIGKVLELMTNKGSCNVRLLVIGMATGMMVGDGNDIEARRFHGGEILRARIHKLEEEPHAVEISEDFADCKELVTVSDAFKAANAIHSYALPDSPYFPVPPLDF